ncbi:MAG: carboxypeptidase-like regulatory domain-containing protein, partial [Acidobacteriota bacterium]
MKRRPANRILHVLFGGVLLVLMSSFALAQENTGSIRGTIKDSTGAAIPGAKVTATSPALVRSLDTVSDREGAYRFPKLPAGIYTVSASQTGFK